MKNFKINLENLNEEDQDELLKLIEKANKPKTELWSPKRGEGYYYIDGDGYIRYGEYGNSEYDDNRISIGNFYKTKDDVAFEIERRIVIHELNEFSNNYHPIKDSFKGEYYCLEYNIKDEQIYVRDCSCATEYYNDIYFKTEDLAKEAIKYVGKDRIKKYYFKVV